MKNNLAYANGTLLSFLEVFSPIFLSFFINQKLYPGFTVQERNHLNLLPGDRIFQAQEHHFHGVAHRSSTYLTQGSRMCGCGSWIWPGSCDNDSAWQLWDSLSYTMERRCLQELGEVWMLPVPSTGLLTCLIIAIKPQFFVFKHAHWIIIDAV